MGKVVEYKTRMRIRCAYIKQMLLDAYGAVSYTHLLRGIGRPNQALAGGLLQILIKISIVAIGVWSLHILDVVWLSWPLSFIAGSIIPIICFHHYLRESAGKH